MHTALIAPALFDGFERQRQIALLIEGDTVRGPVAVADIPAHYRREELTEGVLTPGLLDLQVNGGGGVLYNNQPDRAALDAMAAGHARAGVARIMATLISDRPAITATGIDAAVAAAGDPHSGILGVHVEGPFFSRQRNGVHHPDWLRHIHGDDWRWLESAARVPAIVTLAPEQVDPADIARVVALGIRVSAGHTNATYADVARALEAGLSGFTHLFNAMRPLKGREPGVVGAALTDTESWCGVIADGIHVHPASLSLALNSKPRGRLYLVSDAMATIGSDTKYFDLYREKIREEDGRLVNAAGRLAGSAISLTDAVRYCARKLGLTLDEAVRMGSRYPAEYLGVDDRYGSLRPGRVADITWFDDNLQVKGLWRAGERLY